MTSHDMFNQSQTTETTDKVRFGSVTCTDILGNTIQEGDYFTPIGLDSCLHCQCDSGLPKSCVTASCAKPTCKDYEQIPGKCCEYKCPSALAISDSKELAIILSLGVAFVIILILIVVVWKRSRKPKRASNAPERYRLRADTDQTDFVPANQGSHAQTESSPVHCTQVVTVMPPPYAPPKKVDPGSIVPIEPPPPYTPHDDNAYGTVV